MSFINSFKRLAVNTIKYGFLQTGIPYFVNKAQETKLQTELRAKRILSKALIGIFGLLFFLIFLAFLFISIFFFLANESKYGVSALITSSISFIFVLIIGIGIIFFNSK